MKKITFLLFLATSLAFAQQYEYSILTSVESVVPNGLGRSRLLSVKESRNYKDFASDRTENNKQNDAERSELRVENYEEVKLLNFYNLGGIRFQNIASNDAVITSKINDLVSEGWDLAFVTSGVESSGYKDALGIFITRYIFRKAKKQ